MRYHTYKVAKAGNPISSVHAAENDQQTLCGKEITDRWYIVPNSDWKVVQCRRCRELIAQRSEQIALKEAEFVIPDYDETLYLSPRDMAILGGDPSL